MMGDVAVSPWHDEPFTPNVTINVGPTKGITSMNVIVTDEEGQGVYNFRCSFFDGEVLLGLAYTNEEGLAVLDFGQPIELADGMKLIVTGCDAWPHTTVIDLTATEENHMSHVTLYPNPNSGQFSLNLPEEDCEIVIFNAMGQQVYQTSAKGMTTLTLEGLDNGVYFVTVKSASGVNTLKFVKK